MSVEERMKILKMIEEGKITAEEGTRLLSAVTKQDKRASGVNEGLVNVGMRMGARFIPDADQDIVMEDLAEALQQGMVGKIVDVVDEEEGQRVEIFVE
jgi:polyhydroxyalkanoate synthesis regulator phasin